jgi:hypothetical protein
MQISISLSLGGVALLAGGLHPPLGFVFLIDTDGAYLTDGDGAYLMEAI